MLWMLCKTRRSLSMSEIMWNSFFILFSSPSRRALYKYTYTDISPAIPSSVIAAYDGWRIICTRIQSRRAEQSARDQRRCTERKLKRFARRNWNVSSSLFSVWIGTSFKTEYHCHPLACRHRRRRPRQQIQRRMSCWNVGMSRWLSVWKDDCRLLASQLERNSAWYSTLHDRAVSKNFPTCFSLTHFLLIILSHTRA